jgi:gamma-glutamyltranspeptidase / glutathione hydrolase
MVPQHRPQAWDVRKSAVRSSGGIVASQHHVASAVGARILEAGGNATDAAVATGFALAVIEPWNSGIGGVGYLVMSRVDHPEGLVVDFGPVSPHRLDPAHYPLTEGTTPDLFNWPSVLEDRNVHGPSSFAVPGMVDGLGLALEHFGTMELSEVVGPAIELAERGLPVDWYLTLKVATMAQDLARYPSTAELWLQDGFPPVTSQGPYLRLPQQRLAETLRAIAGQGRREFYEGALAASIAEDVDRLGGVLDAEDLRSYRACVVEALSFQRRGATIWTAPGLTAGPTLAEAFARLADFGVSGTPGVESYLAYAEALRGAYAERLAVLGASGHVRDPTSTTHLCVVDKHGTIVALTQTLLSVFGSKVVLPSSGILMNNGIMWFDPRPGQANSLGPACRPLTNMCPVVVERDGRPLLGIGASGGRKILPAVFQLLSFVLDHELDLEEAFHQPRIDASGGARITIDPRLASGVKASLASAFPADEVPSVVFPNNYACPTAVLVEEIRSHVGMVDLATPWSAAVAEDQEGALA